MYLKIIGIVLIMMSASLMGYLFSKDYIERINRLEQIQKMLILLKGESGGVCGKSSGKF